MQVFYRLIIYVLLLENQLSRGKGCVSINWFNPTTFLCLYQARTWISNVICCGHGLFVFSESVKMIANCLFC